MTSSRNLDIWNDFGDHMIPVMPFMDNVIDHAEGSYLIDVDGKRILDLAAGQFCTILGHSHPEFTRRLSEEMSKCLHTGSQYVTESVLRAAKKVSEITPPGLDNVIFLSTGSEANEFALRVAKAYTGRTGALGFDRGYYGISLATRSLSTLSDGHVDFSPKVADSFHLLSPHCRRCPLRLHLPECDMSCLSVSLDMIGPNTENIAGIIVETVISAGGMIFPPQAYMHALRKVADDIGALLIVDEAQTGFGRCGRWFDVENLEIQPDILVFSKTSGNGFPTAGVVISDIIKEKLLDKGFFHLSSHQNDPLAATAVSAVIDIIQEGRYLEHCRDHGNYFLDRLGELEAKHAHCSAVRGRGLMIAFELIKDGVTPWDEMLPPFVLACKDAGVHVTYTYYEGAIRIIPAINISREDIDFAVSIFDDMLNKLAAGELDVKATEPKNKVARDVLYRSKTRRILGRLWETSPKYWLEKLRSSK